MKIHIKGVVTILVVALIISLECFFISYAGGGIQ